MSTFTTELLVQEEDIGKRLDIFLHKNLKPYSRSFIKKIINDNGVKINEKYENAQSYKVKPKDLIQISFVEKEINLIPKKIKLDIIYEDEDLIVINKQMGVSVHPGAGDFKNTIANGLAFRFKELSNLNGKLRPGIVHRLDKDTTGLLLVAKNNNTHAQLAEQFEKHSIIRTYWALVWGNPRPLNSRIETLIVRSDRNRQMMMVSENKGKKAITNYKTLEVFNNQNIPRISLIECQLETGRTHQIRVHMKYKKNSIVGDQIYGKKLPKFKNIDKNLDKILKGINRQMLHAKSISFFHPIRKENLSFDTKLPKDMNNLINMLKTKSK